MTYTHRPLHPDALVNIEGLATTSFGPTSKRGFCAMTVEAPWDALREPCKRTSKVFKASRHVKDWETAWTSES